jgi:hypothetical protein
MSASKKESPSVETADKAPKTTAAKPKTEAKPKAAKKTTVREDLISLIDKAQGEQDTNPTEANGNAIASLRNALHCLGE